MSESAIYFFREDIDYIIKGKRKLRTWIRTTIASENKDIQVINLIVCSDPYLLSINKSFLERDYLTDVIAFDYSDMENISGDIFFSIDRIRENAIKFNTKVTDELHRVIIHGILHLIGYNDKQENERIIMREKESYYLSLLA